MFSVLACLLLILLFLTLFGAGIWKVASKRGERQAHAQYQKILWEEQSTHSEAIQRIRDAAAQEIQMLNRECDRLRQENAQLKMPTMEMAKHWSNIH